MTKTKKTTDLQGTRMAIAGDPWDFAQLCGMTLTSNDKPLNEMQAAFLISSQQKRFGLQSATGSLGRFEQDADGAWDFLLMAHRAPKGGVTIGGTFYAGGKFIPNEAMASATPEEKAQLVGTGGDKAETPKPNAAGKGKRTPNRSPQAEKAYNEAMHAFGNYLYSGKPGDMDPHRMQALKALGVAAKAMEDGDPLKTAMHNAMSDLFGGDNPNDVRARILEAKHGNPEDMPEYLKNGRIKDEEAASKKSANPKGDMVEMTNKAGTRTKKVSKQYADSIAPFKDKIASGYFAKNEATWDDQGDFEDAVKGDKKGSAIWQKATDAQLGGDDAAFNKHVRELQKHLQSKSAGTVSKPAASTPASASHQKITNPAESLRSYMVDHGGGAWPEIKKRLKIIKNQTKTHGDASAMKIVNKALKSHDRDEIDKHMGALRDYLRSQAKGGSKKMSFDESKHPRNHGQFTSGSGNSGSSSKAGGKVKHVTSSKKLPKPGTHFTANFRSPKTGKTTKMKFVEVTGAARLNRKRTRYGMGGNKVTVIPGWTSLRKGERVFRVVE